MGGIAGIIHFHGEAPERALLEAMSEAVAHRGPDDAGLWAEGPAGLVQRRMALTRTGRRQPITQAPHTLVLDGRIYEGASLREALRREGVEPATTGDADAVLSAWGLWGQAAVQRLHGDFALAVWDAQRRSLVLARDPAGVKPLYWAHQGGRFAFASDVRALLLLPWVSRELATEELSEYLSFRYTHAPRTLLREVHQVPAGHVLRVDETGVQVWRWHRPSYVPPEGVEPPEPEVARRLETALGFAVERRLWAEHPVGVLLSGGTASAALLTLAAERTRQLTAYTVAFADEAPDEAAFAGRVAALAGASHRVVQVQREEFLAAVDDAVRVLGQPVPSPAAIPQLLVCRAARQDVRILLSGDGGDELLGGARTLTLPLELRVEGPAQRLPGPLRRLVLREVEGSADEPFGLARRIGGSRVFDVQSRRALLRDPGLVHPDMRRTMLEPLYHEVQTDPINEVLHVYFRGWLAEDSLLRSDRVSAAAGVEVRYPLLDPDVVALCTGLPGKAKIKRRLGRWHNKWPLKRMLEARNLPPTVVWAPKRGTPSPLHRWLRSDPAWLTERVESLCADPWGLFRPEVIHTLAREHREGLHDRGSMLWTLIFFDLWARGLAR